MQSFFTYVLLKMHVLEASITDIFIELILLIAS